MKLYSAVERTPTMFPGKLGEWEARYISFCHQVFVFTAKIAMLPMVSLAMVPVALRRLARILLWLIAAGGVYASKYGLYFMSAVVHASWVLGVFDPGHFYCRALEEAAETALKRLVPEAGSAPADAGRKSHNRLLQALGCVMFVIVIVPATIVTLPFAWWEPKEQGRNYDLKRIIADEIAIVHRAFIVFVPVVLVVAMFSMFAMR